MLHCEPPSNFCAIREVVCPPLLAAEYATCVQKACDRFNARSEPTEFIREVRDLALPTAAKIFGNHLIDLRDAVSGLVAIRITGLPAEPQAGPTPYSPHCFLKKSFYAEASNTLIAAFLGSLHGLSSLQGGHTFQDICANRGTDKLVSSVDPQHLLPFHNDNGRSPFRPDFIVLSTIRGDPLQLAETYVSGVDQAEKSLTCAQSQLLRDNLFQLGSPGSHDAPLSWSNPMSLLSGPIGAAELRLNGAAIRPLSCEAENALTGFLRALENVKVTVKLRAGDVLVISQRRAAHSRSVFTSNFQANERWLVRSYIIASSTRLQSGISVGEVTRPF